VNLEPIHGCGVRDKTHHNLIADEWTSPASLS
jgi:hypothetical protein